MAKSRHFTVSCDCPTPLAMNPYTALAESEADAVAKFKRRNGISGSDHKITVAEGKGGKEDEAPAAEKAAAEKAAAEKAAAAAEKGKATKVKTATTEKANEPPATTSGDQK